MFIFFKRSIDSTTATTGSRPLASFIPLFGLAMLGILAQGTGLAGLTMSLNTAAVSLNPAQSQTFTATVTGPSNTAVIWTVTPAVGTLATNGNTTTYTAPAVVAAAQVVTLTAELAMDTMHTVSATISLQPVLNVTPSSATLTGSGQSVALATNGANIGGSRVVAHALGRNDRGQRQWRGLYRTQSASHEPGGAG